ncbi:MAG: 4'-phosphopantetheinyl transferase family protein [Mucilaginibacter sp.]
MIISNYTEISHHWSKQELAGKLVLLPEKLQQEAMRKRLWIDQQLSVAGKLILSGLLEKFDHKFSLSDLKYNSYHRPYIDGGPDFNIAHSGSIVICCITEIGNIGIDIEQVKEIDLSDYTDYFTPNEWRKIDSYPNKYDGFYNFWTRKEAVLKAIGTGFHTPLSAVDVAEECVIYDDITYYLRSIEINPDYKCHVATTNALASIQLTCVNL